MYDIINVFDMITRFFGNWLWFALFLAAIVYGFLRGNRDQRFAMLSGAAFFFLFINDLVMRLMDALGQKDVYYRNLWAIPVMTVIWLPFVDLFRRCRCVATRILVVSAGVAVLCFVQSDPPLKGYIESPLDLNLVPKDVIQISDTLDRLEAEQGKKLAVSCPNALVDPLTLYNGRSVLFGSYIISSLDTPGEDILHSGEPDVAYIMFMCCGNGMDYVIVPRLEHNIEVFRTNGHEPILETDTYALFSCYGAVGVRVEYNRWEQITSISNYDADGKPTFGPYGYGTIRYAYDGTGLKTSDKYFYPDGNPMLFQNRHETRYAYNRRRQAVEERYYDLDGLPVMGSEYVCAARHFEYDGEGRVIVERYFDTVGCPMPCANGYAEVRREYDLASRLVRETYWDVDENPVILAEGGHGFTREYDDEGNLIAEVWIDENGTPVMPAGKQGS